MALLGTMLAPRSHRSLLVALGLLVVAAGAPARADDLPPKDAPAFTAVYHAVTQTREKAQDPWTYTVDDTVTIAVMTKLSRWDHKSDGHTILNDAVGRYTTVFGGKTAAGTAIRTQIPFTPINWEFGYGTVADVIEGKPEVLGASTVAGHACTRIRFVSEQYGEPEYCVTKTGIVLRFSNASSTGQTVYEAQSLDEKPPDKGLFSVPAGLKVQETSGPARDLKRLKM